MLGPEHPHTLAAMNYLANVYCAHGKYAPAEALYSQTLAIQRRLLAPEHSDTLNSMYNLAGTHAAEAEALFSQLLESDRRRWGPEHPEVLGAVAGVASMYQPQGKYTAAEGVVPRPWLGGHGHDGFSSGPGTGLPVAGEVLRGRAARAGGRGA